MSSGEGGSVAVRLGSVGHVAGETRVKHTTKLRADQGQRRARAGVAWAVLGVPGFFHACFSEKSGREKQERARSRSG